MDIHAGEGGEDSRLFVRDLLTAYLKYARQNNLVCEIVYDSDSSCSVHIEGKGCWEAFCNESGKHIVQRVPATESKGRRHTSVVAVSVMPLATRTASSLSLEEVEITTQRGHGRGGQNQNKVESAVRAVHKPTGISVFINGRDQFRNKQLALEILEGRVAELKQQAIDRERSRMKSEQLGYCSRSGKVRTYNFINSVAIDHRTGCKTHRLSEVMKGRFELLR